VLHVFPPMPHAEVVLPATHSPADEQHPAQFAAEQFAFEPPHEANARKSPNNIPIRAAGSA